MVENLERKIFDNSTKINHNNVRLTDTSRHYRCLETNSGENSSWVTSN